MLTNFVINKMIDPYTYFKKRKRTSFMKIKKLLILLILPLVIIISGCKDNDIQKISKNLNTYEMNITYNDDHTLTVSQQLDYTNRTTDELSKINFHLYPRSFREDSNCSVVSTLNYSKCYYNGKSYGNLEVSNITVDNTVVDIFITGYDEDILEVKLPEALKPDSSCTISIDYTVTIPNINHRFGYGENTINLGNFYPVVCVYENGKFVEDSYHYNGDPFYSEMANYSVKITAANTLKLASTGSVTETQFNDNNTNTYNISAIAVRDFAFVLSDNFSVVTDTIDDTVVNYYYYKNQYPAECLTAGIKSISTFNSLFGKYPYPVINIVETNFVHGGMEYPNMVMISDAVDIQSDYINVIVHEIAHQWWYGLVGNNEFEYGWLDEGLTEYSTLLFYEQNPEYNIDCKQLIKNTTNSFATFVEVYDKVFGSADTTMNRALDEYNNESEYVYIAYVKGMLLFDSVREIIGHDKFISALQEYFSSNKFKIATPEKLITAFEKSSGDKLSSLFESWINGKVKIIPIK